MPLQTLVVLLGECLQGILTRSEPTMTWTLLLSTSGGYLLRCVNVGHLFRILFRVVEVWFSTTCSNKCSASTWFVGKYNVSVLSSTYDETIV